MRATRGRGRGRAARPGLERLEGRVVMAAEAAYLGTITLYGTTAADVIRVEPADEPGLTRVSGTVADRPFELFYAGAKRVVAYLGDGDDVFEIQADLPATVYAGGGADLLVGGPKGDRLYGEAGDDTIQGGDGNDSLYGGLGDDAIDGGLGGDLLDGGNGRDTLDGRPDGAVNTLIGGAGADTFFVQLMYVGRSTRRRDQVRDFNTWQGDFIYSRYPWAI